MNGTLSSKLFIRIAPTIIATILLIGGFAFHSADKEINKVYDAQLISNANILWTLISDELRDAEINGPRKIDDMGLRGANSNTLNDSADVYADSRMFRVWKSGRIMLYSDTALPASVAKQPNGFSTVTYKNEGWRIFKLSVPGQPVSIEVGEKVALRNTLVTNILLNLAIPLLLLVPILGVLIWFGIGSGLGTIHNLVGQILKRSPDDLSHVDTKALPKDLAPLGKSLNQLLTKLEYSFATEKRFTDHAAHQLRTPQATIKLQLQMLAKATSEKEKEALIKELMLSNERASKLVNMLLTSTRLNHQPVNLQEVAAYNAIAGVMADLGLLAKNKNIEMSLDGAENTVILADEILFRLMMGNVIENAVKYTPPGGNVRVWIESQGKNYKISVEDTGCGIPEKERRFVFDRFYRISMPGTEGSGLGLAIVSDIIDRFSGSIELKTPKNDIGLLVEITLPAK
jgi:two-component system sensor histidine kinase QseC